MSRAFDFSHLLNKPKGGFDFSKAVKLKKGDYDWYHDIILHEAANELGLFIIDNNKKETLHINDTKSTDIIEHNSVIKVSDKNFIRLCHVDNNGNFLISTSADNDLYNFKSNTQGDYKIQSNIEISFFNNKVFKEFISICLKYNIKNIYNVISLHFNDNTPLELNESMYFYRMHIRSVQIAKIKNTTFGFLYINSSKFIRHFNFIQLYVDHILRLSNIIGLTTFKYIKKCSTLMINASAIFEYESNSDTLEKITEFPNGKITTLKDLPDTVENIKLYIGDRRLTKDRVFTLLNLPPNLKTLHIDLNSHNLNGFSIKGCPTHLLDSDDISIQIDDISDAKFYNDGTTHYQTQFRMPPKYIQAMINNKVYMIEYGYCEYESKDYKKLKAIQSEYFGRQVY